MKSAFVVTRCTGLGLLLGGLLCLAGCTGAPAPPAGANATPKVSVSTPLHQEITDYAEYTGRTAAVEMVQIRARVSGYLDKVHYQEGSEVKAGAVLYEIDPRPYQAALTQAQSQVKLQQAQVVYQRAVYARDVRLGTEGQAISQEEIQQARAQEQTAEASLEGARANVDQAKLNLEWTKITSPIDGLTGRTLVTRGNLIVADQTFLTTIVSQDPMYLYFDVDEPTALHVQELIREGKYHSAREKGSRVPVYIGLTTEEGYPHEGYVDFINNQVVSGTGTLPIRAVFANPRPAMGPRLLSPGLFVRVRVAVSAPYSAFLVSQSAVGTDQNLRFVYVVDDSNNVVRRQVRLGPAQSIDLQVITEGLTTGDRVVVSGTQHVHPGMHVEPSTIPMPTGAAANARGAAQSNGPPAPAPAGSQPAPSQQQNYPAHGQSR